MFTYHYAQPDEYRFSLDSIHLAEFVANQIRPRSDLKSLRVLDLCAGCGVIGFQLSWFIREIIQFDFVEVQEVYTEFFHKNVSTVNRSELQCRWHLANYDVLLEKSWENQFDLIISNPPYFQPEDGMLSPSAFKNRCRFFLDSSFSNFILAMVNTLKAGGEAYFLLQSLKQHGYHLIHDIQALLKDKASANKIAEVRGTDVIYLKKHDIN